MIGTEGGNELDTLINDLVAASNAVATTDPTVSSVLLSLTPRLDVSDSVQPLIKLYLTTIQSMYDQFAMKYYLSILRHTFILRKFNDGII